MELEVMVERCAFLDVHRDTAVACARTPDGRGGRTEEVAEFGTTVSQLLALGDWLCERGVTRVGMEATGVYWKPVHWVLEAVIAEVWVINARHMRNVPGHKTDVADSVWGCVAPRTRSGPSKFHPAATDPCAPGPDPIPEIGDRGPDTGNPTPSQGFGGRRCEVVVGGIEGVVEVRARDDRRVDRRGTRRGMSSQSWPRGRMRSKIPRLKDALAGRFNEHHALLCQAMLARVDQADATIDALGVRIGELLDPFEAAVSLLVTIPGVSQRTAQVIIAEIGADMSRFPDAGHLASWAGMCPGNNESAGKHRSGRTRHGSKWLRKALIEAAHARVAYQRHLPGGPIRPDPLPAAGPNALR
jgi:transposase